MTEQHITVKGASVMSDDPASVADALERLRADFDPDYDPTTCERLEVAARLLRDHADTTNRLAATQQRLDEMSAIAQEAIEEGRATAARLSALTDAIGNPKRYLWSMAMGGYVLMPHDREYLLGIHDAAAAAVQPPDPLPPSVCPTCRSDDPDMRRLMCQKSAGFWPDSWHQR